MIDSLLKVNSIDLKFDPHSNIMKDNNYSKLDLLKMDIEGAEYEVIDHIQKNNTFQSKYFLNDTLHQ